VATLRWGKNRVLIYSDGKNYYIWARSILLDHDIDFRNDYRLTHYQDDPLPPEHAVRTPAGYVVDKYPVGMAILEAPGLLLGHVAARYVWHTAADGVSRPYQVAVAWSLLVLYFASFVLLYQAMLCLGVARIWALSFCLTALVGTNLVHYVAKEPTMPHAAGVAILNISLFLVARWGGQTARIRPVRGILLGALVGLLFLIRSTNMLMLPGLVALASSRRRVSGGEVVPILLGVVSFAALQPISLWFLWGRLRLSTYMSESFTSGVSGLVNVLVSARHGLLVYSPWYAVLLLIAAYGAFRVPQARRVCIAVIVSFFLMVLANGTWWCWWFGWSYGNRAFIETLPLLSLAAAMSLSRLGVSKRTVITVGTATVAVVVLNLYLWLGYLLKAYPHDGSHTIGQAYLWLWLHSPASLIQHLAH